MVGSPPQAKPDPRVFGKPIFYGWWLVAINCVLGALGGGVYTFGISAFIVPLSEEFDVGRGTVSWAVALASLEGAVLGPVLGFMVDRFGPRKVMYFGITMMGIGYILSSWAPSITWFFILFVPLVAIGSGAGLFSPPAAAIGNWFVRKRALAFSISMSGWGVGGVMVILTNFLVQTLGWREAMLILGLTVMAVAYPMAGFVRHRPEQYGYYPDGSRVPPEQPTASARPGTGTEIDFTVKEALSSAAFWLIGISFAARMFAVAGVSSHFIPMMQAKGFSAEAGASLLAMYGIATIPSRVLFGYLGDRISKVGIVGAMGGLMAVAMLVLAVSDGLGMTVFAILMYATAWGGGGGAMMLAIRGEFFGRKNFATIAGFGNVIQTVGVFSGPIFAGYTFDITGTYTVAHWSYIGFALTGMLCMLLARRPVPKRLRGTVAQ